MGQTNYCTGCEEAPFLGKYYTSCCECTTNNLTSMCVSIYNIQYLSIHVYNHIYICTV